MQGQMRSEGVGSGRCLFPEESTPLAVLHTVAWKQTCCHVLTANTSYVVLIEMSPPGSSDLADPPSGGSCKDRSSSRALLDYMLWTHATSAYETSNTHQQTYKDNRRYGHTSVMDSTV